MENSYCDRRTAPYDPRMIEEHDFHYAMENTRVVVQPEQTIETFGSTNFRFLLVSEMMDEASAVRVRGGRIEAERPRIMSPHHYSKLLLDGFGESVREYTEWLEANPQAARILRYGFQLRKYDIEENVVHDSMETVLDRLQNELAGKKDSRAALIAGVEDGWEVCLLKFTMDLIQRSAGENVDEWKRRGFL